MLNRTTLPGLDSSTRQALNTVTVNEHKAVLPEVSVAVQVTVVVPTGNVKPEAGLQTTVTPGQLSDAMTVKLTIWLLVGGQLAAAVVVILAGHVMVGGCVSLTVTVNVQLGPAVVVQVTVVVPFGKNEPDAGEQLAVPQVPVVVGDG